MSIIKNKDVHRILFKAFRRIDENLFGHCERVGYILYKMLQCEGECKGNSLIDYTMAAVFHDIGIFRTGCKQKHELYETTYLWEHSIYGYLFLRYLSPVKEKAEMVLYHHLDYFRFNMPDTEIYRITEYLNVADKMDLYLNVPEVEFPKKYFETFKNVRHSGRALDLFLRAEKTYGIISKLKDGSYYAELDRALATRRYSEDQKHNYITMLNYLIDFRSEHTVLHTLGTTTFALELARLLEFPSKDIESLYYGALLHDIGKVDIPVEILEAPRRLSDKEMNVMKSHVINTENILRGIVDDEVLNIAIRHHEKMDGSGYPYGIKEDMLTPMQRVVAVADILSALYQKRSYKDSMPKEKIAAILKEDMENGKLCSVVTECAIANLDSIIKDFDNRKDYAMGTYLKIKEQSAMLYEKFKIYE